MGWSRHENQIREVSVGQGARVDVESLRVKRFKMSSGVFVVVDEKDVCLSLVFTTLTDRAIVHLWNNQRANQNLRSRWNIEAKIVLGCVLSISLIHGPLLFLRLFISFQPYLTTVSRDSKFVAIPGYVGPRKFVKAFV